MRKGASAAFPAPQAFALRAAVFSSYVARMDSVWPVSHHQPRAPRPITASPMWVNTPALWRDRAEKKAAAAQP